MKCFIGLGSNLGNSNKNMEGAARALQEISLDHKIRLSPLYTTEALVPPGAPNDWNKCYRNAVAEIYWQKSAEELLSVLKKIENELGREAAPKWAPRIIDLDLLTMGEMVLNLPNLIVPHPELLYRSFVLDPLKDLEPQLILPDKKIEVKVQSVASRASVVHLARKLETHRPLIMAILNVTPDSFSDGGVYTDIALLREQLQRMSSQGVHYIDLGAESTRPGAQIISAAEEWARLEQPLEIIQKLFSSSLFRPKISLDTRNASVARKAIAYGVDMINDVSGMADPLMVEVLKDSNCDYVITHSLTVPADPQVVLPADMNIIEELKKWLDQKLSYLSSVGIDLNRIVFDPGLGFGKRSSASIQLLNEIDRFSEYPVRIMVGHSRKSFLKMEPNQSPIERDKATLEFSIELAKKGVDILRVHNFEEHLKEFYE